MNTTFDSYDDALEALAQIEVWKDEIDRKIEYFKTILNIPGISKNDKLNWEATLEDLKLSFEDNIGSYAKTAKHELDENPWLREVAGDRIWRRAGE